MALTAHRFEEIANSRTGSTVGALGIRELQVWRVDVAVADGTTLDDYDPIYMLQTNKIPKGTPHRWNPHVTAQNFTIADTIEPVSYLISVEYIRGEPGSTVDPEVRRWMWTLSGAAMTQTVLEEPIDAVLNQPGQDRPGRSGIVKARSVPLLGTEVQPKPMGTTKFVKSTNTESRFFTDTYDDSGNAVRVYLKNTPAHDMFDYQADIRAANLVATRLFPNFPEPLWAQLVNSEKMVNRWKFKGASPGHLLLDDYHLAEIGAVIQDGEQQQEKGVAYRLSISILWATIAWTPEQRVPKWVGPKGGETYVMYRTASGTEQKLVEEFRVKPALDFNGHLRSISQAAWRG